MTESPLRDGMPWGRGRPPAAPAAATAAPPGASTSVAGGTASPAPEAPLSSVTRFRVENVYTITGLGCIVVGTVEEGSIRPPAPMRLVRVVDGAEVAIPVEVVEVMVNKQPVTELLPGIRAGMRLRGLRREHSFLGRGGYPVQKGNRLLSP